VRCGTDRAQCRAWSEKQKLTQIRVSAVASTSRVIGFIFPLPG
jgi:hypothetical protein